MPDLTQPRSDPVLFVMGDPPAARRVVLSVCSAIFVVAIGSQLVLGGAADADVAYAIAVAGVGLGMGPRWGVVAAAVAAGVTLTIGTGGGHVVQILGYFALGALSGTVAEGLRGARNGRLRHLAQVVAQTDAAILSISLPDGLVTSWNPRCEELLGWSADEVLGRNASFLVGDGGQAIVREHAKVLLSGKRIGLESRWATRAGGAVDVSVTAAPLTAGGTPIGASIVAIDISTQAAALHALGQAEDRFREAFAHAPAGMAVVSHEPPLDGRLLQVNPALTEITGVSEQELLETGFDRLLRDDQRAVVLGRDREARLLRPDGELIWVQVSSSRVEDQDGIATHSIAQVQDITARKVAETVSSRLAAIVADSSDAIVANDLEGTIVHWNRAAEELYGYTREEAIGLHSSALVPEALRDGERSRFDAVLKGRSIAARETQRHTSAGEIIDVSVTISPIRDDYGNIVGASSIARDITQEKVAVETLRASEDLLRSIVDTAGEGILVVDRDGVITFANEKMSAIAGVPPREMHGRAYTDFMPRDPHERERAQAIMQSRLAGVADRHEYPYTRPDGSDGWLVVSGSPMYGPEGEITGSLAMMTEITEQVAAEQERQSMEAVLHQSQRLESLGELAGGVAHDMNNLLAVITNFADFALVEIADGPGTEEINEIRRASSSAAGLIRQLLLFARQELTQSEILDPNELLADREDILRQLAGPKVEVVSDYAEDLPRVNVDPGMLEQVAMNLVVNARDAMPDGGIVSIATAKVVIDADVVGGAAAGEYVALRVTDAGEGMTAEVAARAFDPFFSTKPRGGGTGLGLATVYGIAKRFGGHVEIDSHPGAGTRMTVYLPAAAPADDALPQAADAPSAAAATPCGTILLVEDDDAVRRAAARILRDRGYDVIAAAGSNEAIVAARDLARPLDLLLTDIAMPEMSGPSLAAKLQATQPGLPVVFASGYTDRPHELPVGAHFVSKPFDGPALLAGVAAAWKS
jgi:PAS domain S-box-containing protein